MMDGSSTRRFKDVRDVSAGMGFKKRTECFSRQNFIISFQLPSFRSDAGHMILNLAHD